MIKKVGTAMYVHKSNLEELYEKLSKNEKIRIENIIINFDKDYEIVKYDKGKLSLIESPNWNSANEPDVGNSYCFTMNKSEYKIIKASGKIYHNKWMFVTSNYDGFDVEEAKKRSEIWNAIPDIKEHKTRIGNKTYWLELLKQNNIPI